MAVETVFVILSDLHFGRDLLDGPELPLVRFSRFVKWFRWDDELSRYFEEKCLGHSIACVKKLPRYLKFLLREAQDEGYDSESFDLFILLGDQVTFPDEQSYRFLREYLSATRYETADADAGHYCSGLGISDPFKILAIPGNHDKLLRSNLDFYHLEFTRKLKLAEEIEPNRCRVAIKMLRRREFLFILLDANVYLAEDLTLDANFRDHLARGAVSKSLYDDATTKLKALKQGNTVDGSSLAGPFKTATKMIIAHYAVDLGHVAGTVHLKERILPHDCEGLDKMVDALQREFQVNLVLHGHLHIPALYAHNRVQVVSATTTTQVGGPNGFFLLKFYDTGEVRTEHHSWNGAAFAADPSQLLNRPLVSV